MSEVAADKSTGAGGANDGNGEDPGEAMGRVLAVVHQPARAGRCLMRQASQQYDRGRDEERMRSRAASISGGAAADEGAPQIAGPAKTPMFADAVAAGNGTRAPPALP